MWIVVAHAYLSPVARYLASTELPSEISASNVKDQSTEVLFTIKESKEFDTLQRKAVADGITIHIGLQPQSCRLT